AAITRGIYFSPYASSTTDFRALEIAAYTNTTTQRTIAYTAIINPTTYTTSTQSAISPLLTNASTLYLNGAPVAGINATIASSSILTIIGNNTVSVAGRGTTTNAYGLFLTAPSGATNNYAAVFNGGNFGIGTATPFATLNIQGTTSVASILDISSSTGVSILRVTSAQTVGIGSTSPTATLVVQGTST